MTKQKPLKKRKKAGRRKKDEFCSYAIEIRDWELTYSLMLNPNPKYISGQYMESLHLKIKDRSFAKTPVALKALTLSSAARRLRNHD